MEKISKKIDPKKVLEITELFDASPERVFKAWTNKNDFVAWYGPEGFTVPFCEMDVKLGGKWRACIRSAEGEEYWMEGKYIEISAPEKIVFTFGDGSKEGNPDEETIITITFRGIGKKTEMKFHQAVFPTVALRDGHYSGWSSAFVCLKDHLEKTNSNN